MSWFGCFTLTRSPTKRAPNRTDTPQQNRGLKKPSPSSNREQSQSNGDHPKALIFTFEELASAVGNFRRECLVGEGGFGRVYKGKLANGQIVAVKRLDKNAIQGNREFVVEVLMLSNLHHENLVNLIGYSAVESQRLLVYEYLPNGSLEDHLWDLEEHQPPLSWYTRMSIALGAAKGLEYLHDEANPPVIYRDLKSANILLDNEMTPKLSDFGLAKLGPIGDSSHVSSRIMGTYGYCAPEYQLSGQVTVKSDVYSFGVVLLELITGRRVIDRMRPNKEQNLVVWAQPIFREPRRHSELADLTLRGEVPRRGLNQAVAVAAMCLQEVADVRPFMSDVVSALNFLGKVGCRSGTSAGDVPPLNATPERVDEVGRERGQAATDALERAYNASSSNAS